MKPLFGTLNARVARTIRENAPASYRRVVEPFGDNGTVALSIEFRRPREHVVNVVDPALFAALSFAQTGRRADVASFDWVASQETFDEVLAITATEGPEAFYRFLYLRKFGMRMGDGEPVFDILATGKDMTRSLFVLPLMRVLLRRVTLVNGEPSAAFGGGGSDTWWILVPRSPEDAATAEQQLGGLSGSVFLAEKVAEPTAVVDMAKQYNDLSVAGISAPSIMMAKMAVVANYDFRRLQPIDPAALEAGDMAGMAAGGA